MNGVLTRPEFLQEIQEALLREPEFRKVGPFSDDEFKQHCFSLQSTSIFTIVVDCGVASDDAILSGIRLIRMSKENVRFIILAIDRKPGDPLISEIISLGIYDIIELSSELNEQNERMNFSPIIAENLKKSKSYGDIVRWHTISASDNKNVTTEKTKSRVQVKERVKEIEVVKVIQLSNKNIGICNATKRAGSSFFTMNLARALAMHEVRTSVVENPLYPYLFDTLMLDEKEKKEDSFQSVPHSVLTSTRVNKENKDNIYFDIFWNVLDTRKAFSKETQWGINEYLQQINASSSTINLIDLGSNENDEVLKHLDEIYVLIDPAPNEIIQSIDRLGYFVKLEEDGLPIKYIFNKYNDGVNLELLNENLELDIKYHIPYVEPSNVYKSYFEGKIVYDYLADESSFHQILNSIVNDLAPENTLKKPLNKRWNFFKKRG